MIRRRQIQIPRPSTIGAIAPQVVTPKLLTPSAPQVMPAASYYARPAASLTAAPVIAALFTGAQALFVFPNTAQATTARDARSAQQPTTQWVSTGTEIAPPAQTYVFPTTQPSRQRTFTVTPRLVARSGVTPAPISQSPVAYLLQQPDRALTEAWLRASQYRIERGPYIHQGSSLAAAFDGSQLVVAPIVPPGLRQTPDVKLPFLGVTAVTQTDIFNTVASNPQGYGARPAPRIIVRHVKGLTVPVQNPPDILQQPLDQWVRIADRYGLAIRSGVIPALHQGSTLQQTYVFEPGQPSRTYWYVPRLTQFSAPPPRLEGATLQDLFLFTTTTPDGRYYTDKLAPRLTLPVRWEGAVATPPQTYLFEIGQPSRAHRFLSAARAEQVKPDPTPLIQKGYESWSLYEIAQPSRTFWYVPRRPSEQVPTTPQFSGMSRLRTDPIPGVDGPHWDWFSPWQRWMTHQVEWTETRSSTPNPTRFRRLVTGRTGSRGKDHL